MMAGAMLLIAGCSADDVVKETTSEEAIAISFSCNYDDKEEGNITRAGHQGVMNTEDLYASGFGVMASTTAGTVEPYDNKPNLMYNQEVKFTFVGDMGLSNPADPKSDTLRGYWSYQPVKYWPTDLTHCYISAYAPYVDPTSLVGLPADATGIVGISPNTEEPYITYRRCEKPDKVVDLLWYYKDFVNESGDTEDIPDAGILDMKMHHALARLEIKVAVAADPGTTKVLVDSISLKGTMTRTANLILNKDDGTGDNHYPHWEALDPADTENRTIIIDNEDNNPTSYGIIDSKVRYIPGMPYSWQPAGLTTTLQNALSTGDRTGYVYLIPVGALTVEVKVKYRKWTQGDAKPTTGIKTTTVTPATLVNPLKGNTTYTLNITLSGGI